LGCRRARKAFAAESTIVNVWRFAKSAIRNPKSLLDAAAGPPGRIRLLQYCTPKSTP